MFFFFESSSKPFRTDRDVPEDLRRFSYYLHQVLIDQPINRSYVVFSPVEDSDSRPQMDDPGCPPELKFTKILDRQFRNDMGFFNRVMPSVLRAQYEVFSTKGVEEDETRLRESNSLSSSTSDQVFLSIVQAWREANPASSLSRRIAYQEVLSRPYDGENLDGEEVPPRVSAGQPDWVVKILAGLAQGEGLKLRHRTLGWVVCLPQLLLNSPEGWCLVAEVDSTTRVLAWEDILKVSDTQPWPHERKSLDSILELYHDIYGSPLADDFPEGTRTVAVKMSGKAARWAVTHQLHRTQPEPEPLFSLGTVPDVKLVFKVRSYRDAIELCLRWPELATPLDPPDFIESWKAHLERLSKLYQKISS